MMSGANPHCGLHLKGIRVHVYKYAQVQNNTEVHIHYV